MSGFDHEHQLDEPDEGPPPPVRRRDALVYILWAAWVAFALAALAVALIGGRGVAP